MGVDELALNNTDADNLSSGTVPNPQLPNQVPRAYFADAIIYDDNGTATAVGPSSDTTIDSGSDIGALLQSLHDSDYIIDPNSADSPGGLILIAPGDYSIDTNATFTKHSFFIIGGGNALDRSGNITGGSKITASGDFRALRWDGSNEKIRGGGLRDVHLKGPGRDVVGADGLTINDIDLFRCDNVTCEEFDIGCRVQSADAAHFVQSSFQENATGFWLSGGFYPKIIGGEFSDNDNDGFVLDGGILRPKAIGITAVRNEQNILIADGVLQPRLTDIDAENPSGANSISFKDKGGGKPDEPIVAHGHITSGDTGIFAREVQNLKIAHCIFDWDGNTAMDPAVEVGSGGKDVRLYRNIYKDNVNSRLTDNGVGTRINGTEQRSLGGSTPNETNYQPGDVIEDTDNAGDTYMYLPNNGFTKINT